MRRGYRSARSSLTALGPVLFACSLTAESQPAPPAAESSDEIVITGSWLAPSDAVTHIVVLTESDLERIGAESLGEVLEALPMNAGSPLNTNTDAGLGASRVSLRGLGAERTLVLVNGRRFPNGGLGGDSSVDLNMIPVSWIERVEVLPAGASVVHGSDAIGGVINVITKKKYVGVALGGGWKITERGDGQIHMGRASFGFNLFEGSWALGLEYVDQDGVTAASRSYSARPLIIVDQKATLGYAGQNGVADGQFEVPEGNNLGLEPAQYIRVTGATSQTAADYRPFTRADSYNPSPFNYSQMPNERAAVQLQGSRSLGETTSLFVEAMTHHRRSSQQAPPDQYLTSSDPAPILSDGTPGIPADNYYNPFGVDLPFVGRRLVEHGNRHGTGEVDMWRAVVGLDGTVGGWNWQVSVSEAKTQSSHRALGLTALTRFVSALGASGPDDSGHIVCGERNPITGRVPPENIVPDCVPLNLFDGAGTITREQLNYISPRPIVDTGTDDQRTAVAMLGGAWGHSLGRDVQWVYGAEYRREAGSQIGDPLRQLGIQNLVNPALPGGSFDVKEVFAEAHVPLLHDHRSARDMGLNVGARRSDFSSFGRNTAWQAGLHWQPVNNLTLHAQYATVFRAPDVFELFETRGLTTGSGFDPCGNEPTPTQQEHCAAHGVPGGAYVQGEDVFALVSGGNPQLQPEEGESIGIGLTYSLPQLSSLSLHIDYNETRLTDVVGRVDVDTLLFECAERGLATPCEAIVRFADGRLSEVSAVNQNLAQRRIWTLDLAADFGTTTPFGDISGGLTGTYLGAWNDQALPGGDFFDHAGRLSAGALPRWRASGNIGWRRGNWVLSYSVDYIGNMTEEVFDFPPFGIFFDPFLREVPSILYHDISAGHKFSNGLAVRAAVKNLSDQDPPFINLVVPENTDAATYRLLGRTYFMSVRYGFR